MKNSVIIVDDQTLFAEGIKSILISTGNFIVKGIASSGLECLGLIDKNKPDLIIINSSIGEISGIDILKIIREHKMPIKILFISSEINVNVAIDALNYNVDGLILKNSSLSDFLSAINSILEDNQFIHPLILDAVNSYLAQTDNCKKTTLTKRETQILCMISAGYLNKEIGSELNISERTVKNHVSNLFKKIGVSDRTQAAVYAIKNNLVNI
ncbi:MAG: response regulator transcription factor [Lachnospira sp.]|nr:response regulator transcription factor [Lachnospira sp.]